MGRAVPILAMLIAAAPCEAQMCGDWTVTPVMPCQPPFGGASLNGVAFGDGLYVAVGEDGLIASSPDGAAWTQHPSGETVDLNGVAWGNGRWVVVGNDGTIVISDDGATWERTTSGSTRWLNAVTWSGSAFIVVGQSETVLTSSDGEAWVKAATPAYDPPAHIPDYWMLRAVACGGGACLAGGCFEWTDAPAGTVLRSMDGVTWDPVAEVYEFPLCPRDLVWTGERWVGAGAIREYHGFARSDLGLTWEWGPAFGEFRLTKEGFRAAATDGQQILAFGYLGMFASPDGVAWSERDSTVGSWVNDVVYANDRWVAVGRWGQTAVSEDGVIWDVALPALFDWLSDSPARNGPLVVAVGGDGSGHPVVYRTTDGVVWARSVLLDVPFSYLRLPVAFGGGFVAMTQTGLAASPDGKAWTALPFPAPYPALEGLACSPVRCVAVGREIVTFAGGETVSRSPLPGGALAAHAVVWTGDRFVAIGHMPGGSTAFFLESPDGLAWTMRTQDGIEPPTTLACHGNRLVALRGGQGRVLTAPVGQPWTILVLPVYDNLLEVTWTGSFFAAIGTKADNRSPALWVSADGTAWHEVPIPSGFGLGWMFGDGSRLSFFTQCRIVSTACSGLGGGRPRSRRV